VRNNREIPARGIVKGVAAGPALIAREPISFLGDLDITSGRVIGKLPSVAGKSVAGTVLLLPATIGSAGAWRFLFQLYKHGTHPAAIVCRELPDPSVVQGAILANIPIVCAPDAELIEQVADGERLEVDGTLGLIRRAAG
jgi:predicted aconitase with swiveling domain